MRICLLSIVLVAASAGAARADDTVPNIYAGIVGGYTASVDLPEGVPEPMGLAVGARGGLTLPTTAVYVGALFLYHAGASVSLGTAGAELSASSYMLGAEGGYELSLGPLVLRPSLGVGLLSQSTDVTGEVVDVSYEGPSDGSEDNLYFSPGFNAMLALGVLLGAELRYNAVLGDPRDSISALATLGLHF